MDAILARMREPSTYAGLATLLGLFGVHFVPEFFQAAVNVLTALAGIAAIMLAEKGKVTS